MPQNTILLLRRGGSYADISVFQGERGESGPKGIQVDPLSFPSHFEKCFLPVLCVIYQRFGFGFNTNSDLSQISNLTLT